MPKNDPDRRKEAARQGGNWTEEEKVRGAPAGGDTGAAGEAEPKAKPTDDRARTEAAAAETEHAPEPDRPVGGGRGHRSMGGSATQPKSPRPGGPVRPDR